MNEPTRDEMVRRVEDESELVAELRGRAVLLLPQDLHEAHAEVLEELALQPHELELQLGVLQQPVPRGYALVGRGVVDAGLTPQSSGEVC